MPRKIKLYKREWEVIHLIKASVGVDFSERPNLKQLSRQYALNVVKINAGFRRLTGKSFYTYYMGLKMEEAKRLLAETEEPVYAISMKLGYTDASNFTGFFTTKVGMSPLQYRSRALNEQG